MSDINHWVLLPYLRQFLEFPYLPYYCNDFESLLAAILKNKQRAEEIFQKNPCRHADVVTVKGIDNMHISHKFYCKKDEHWVEETAKCLFSKDKLPIEICKMIDDSESKDEIDITEFIEAELDKFKGGETVNDGSNDGYCK